jgi:hypothetical protein
VIWLMLSQRLFSTGKGRVGNDRKWPRPFLFLSYLFRSVLAEQRTLGWGQAPLRRGGRGFMIAACACADEVPVPICPSPSARVAIVRAAIQATLGEINLNNTNTLQSRRIVRCSYHSRIPGGSRTALLPRVCC